MSLEVSGVIAVNRSLSRKMVERNGLTRQVVCRVTRWVFFFNEGVFVVGAQKRQGNWKALWCDWQHTGG